MSFVSRVR